jgi:acyl-CoA synthetase (NDP forming)
MGAEPTFEEASTYVNRGGAPTSRELAKAALVLARGLRIWRWSRARVETSNEDGLVQAATEVLKNIKGLLEQESTREPSSNVPFRAALAGVEATAEELVDA